MSHNAKNPKESSLLARCFVCSISRGGSDKKIEKSRIVPRKRRFQNKKHKVRIYRAGSLRKPKFKTKSNYFEKSHKSESCKTFGTLWVFENLFCCKTSKDGTLWCNPKIFEKFLQLFLQPNTRSGDSFKEFRFAQMMQLY